MADSTAAVVEKLIAEPVAGLGYTLWDVRFLKEGASWFLRIFIDKDGGISIDDCTAVSQLVDPLLDQADPIKVPYYLEVCSPGLARALTRPSHFAAMRGREVAVRLVRPMDGQRDFVGTLENADKELFIVADGRVLRFDKQCVASVKLHDDQF